MIQSDIKVGQSVAYPGFPGLWQVTNYYPVIIRKVGGEVGGLPPIGTQTPADAYDLRLVCNLRVKLMCPSCFDHYRSADSEDYLCEECRNCSQIA